MLNLGTLVQEGPCCVFYVTRHQLYWGLTCMVFCWCSNLVSQHTNTHPTHKTHSGASRLTHPYKTNLKKLFVSPTLQKKKVNRAAGKTSFFTLFKENITFYFKCYLLYNCSVNLSWNNTQLYSSGKPLLMFPALYSDL